MFVPLCVIFMLWHRNWEHWLYRFIIVEYTEVIKSQVERKGAWKTANGMHHNSEMADGPISDVCQRLMFS